MIHETKDTALITGASSGIGLELARIFARNGHNLILVAHREERLNAVCEQLFSQYGVECHAITLDLSSPDSAKQLYEQVTEKNFIIEILVNNAGFGTWGLFWENDEEKEIREMQLNMSSLALLTKYFLREMVARGSGKILNVASTAAFQPGPMMAVYYASKSFVASFSEAVSKEAEGTGVTVSVLCPGPTETEFQRHAGMANMHLLKSIFMMDATSVAEKAYAGMMRGKRMIIPGLLNRIVVFTTRFLPKRLLLAVVHSLHKHRDKIKS